MRLILALTLLAHPATAWEFSATPICTLSHRGETGNVTVTYDPALPEYAITITLPDGRWPDTPVFGMAFGSANPITIQTDRHQLSDDRRSLTVKDQGFGNVLNGLEFNSTAIAVSGDAAITIPLAGIAPAIIAFRNCPAESLS